MPALHVTRLRAAAVVLLAAAFLTAWLVLVPLRAHAAPQVTPPPPLGTPTCATSQLRLDKVGGQGFTSHREWDFILRNISPHICKLAGFPKVKLLDKHASPLSVKVVHRGSSSGAVVLHAFQKAKFSFVFVVSGPCIPHFFSAFGLRVTPPGGSAGLVFFAGRFDVCNVNIGGHPTVTAVAP